MENRVQKNTTPPASPTHLWQRAFWGKGGKKAKRYLGRLPRRLAITLQWPKLLLKSSVNYRPIFIVGLAGSGTTLIMQLMNQRFENACAFDESGLLIPRRSSLRVRPVNYHNSIADYLLNLDVPNHISTKMLYKEMQRFYRLEVPYLCTSRVVLDKAPNVHLARAGELASAFSEARFILIFRHPQATIEGLRRKWRLFRREPITESLNFYHTLYDRFLQESKRFRDRTTFISFEQVIENTKEIIEKIGQNCHLKSRKEVMRLPDKGYLRGKGIHHIVEGLVVIDKHSNWRHRKNLNHRQIEDIERELGPLYKRMLELTNADISKADSIYC